MIGILHICVIAGFVATWAATRYWIKKAPMVKLLGRDMNKPDQPLVPEIGGICVIFGFSLGFFLYIVLQTLYLPSSDYAPIFAALCTVLMACIVGIVDDVLGWKAGLKQWQKPILMIFASMPMIVITVGHSSISLPIFGEMDLGLFYPLLIVPIGVVGASNGYNMIAGYNGLETGMGAIILSTMGYAAISIGKYDATALALIMVGALLAFLHFNWYPAKVFPGNTMTYSVGALMACIAILASMEYIALILFLPYFFDFVIQAKGGFQKEAFARVNEDGSIENQHDGIFHMTQLAIVLLKKLKGKAYEWEVVLFSYGVELALVSFIYIKYL